MCDYSLRAVESRPAKIGDQLITTQFRNTLTRGLSAAGEPNVAVCLRPGTEIAFAANVAIEMTLLQRLFRRLSRKQTVAGERKLARFRQIETNNPATHHDAIEFADGEIVLLTRLCAGQRATVLQLPVGSDAQPAARTLERDGSRAQA